MNVASRRVRSLTPALSRIPDSLTAWAQERERGTEYRFAMFMLSIRNELEYGHGNNAIVALPT